MTDLRKAAEMALEALETLPAGASYKTHNAASALRKALEQPNDIETAVRSENEACAKECEAEVKRLRKARELLAWCAVEMHYAGWETRVPDNHGRADVLEAVEEYLK